MPKLVIDGIEFEYGDYVIKYEAECGRKPTLLQFALDHGVEIPYFCYHPAMSIPTNCRMCLCEVGFPEKDRATGELIRDENGNPKINWGRKPATSCNQELLPDMVVRTNRTSPVVEKAQKGVLEFILINHPLDCPICDQAGECPLQINTYKYGPEGSRFELQKVHKPKRVPLGPRVMLDAERCINCTRCTRFAEEISKSKQISIIARGDKNFPAAAPGQVFDDPYSMNTIDLCPVGALTSIDFRFKARVWEMNYTPSVCTGCSRNCSIDVWVRDNQVLRLTPRKNLKVNQYWMCDEGRLDYHKFNERRISGIKTKNDNPIEFVEGLRLCADMLNKHKGKTLFIGSAYATLESNYALKQVAAALGEKIIYYVPHIQKGWGDDFLRKDDRTPNAASCRLLDFKEANIEELKQKLASGKISLVYIVEDDQVSSSLVADLPQNVEIIAHAYQYFEHFEKVSVLVPAATSVEAAGTFINCDNIPQVVMQAKQIARMTPEMWMAMAKSRLDAGGVAVDNWRHPEYIIDCLPSWMLFTKIAEFAKIPFGFDSHKSIFAKLQQEFDILKPIKLPKRNRKESFKMSQFEFAIH
ncbi:MAG: 2Fe-2S iron-sulfur cluster-binding protein [Bacteroidia bacterium]|nr:2Fe-2S iron-sulfur cluster-binding protein [Bacteroidia bacterium]MDW8157702.1 2Fe-2S iron-sulfur cluster-binding protein [Bacteroidia bacterium]